MNHEINIFQHLSLPKTKTNLRIKGKVVYVNTKEIKIYQIILED